MARGSFPWATLLFAGLMLGVAWQVTGFVPTEEAVLGVAWGREAAAAQRWDLLLLSVFAHGGLLHLGFNLLALVGLGPALERSVGSARFAAVFVLAGVAGNVVHASALPQPVVGASGAIFGLIGVVAMLEPRAPIAILIPVPMSAVLAGAIYAVSVPFLMAALPQVPIAHLAHLGGMALGMAASFALHPRRAVRTAPAVAAVFAAVWAGAGLAAEVGRLVLARRALTDEQLAFYGAVGLALVAVIAIALRHLGQLDAPPPADARG